MFSLFFFSRSLISSAAWCPIFFLPRASISSIYVPSHFVLIFQLFFLLFLSSFLSVPLSFSLLVLTGFFSCFFNFTTMLVCDWLRVMWLHVPPTRLLASRLQWVTLSGLWVWALPPQALRPLAGCTGAFPGQVPSTTCVTPHLPSLEKKNSWCSIFLLTCTIQQSVSTNYRLLHYTPATGSLVCWQRQT